MLFCKEFETKKAINWGCCNNYNPKANLVLK
jgi:hypothetical protein